ncbi:MAG: ROK family protein [Hominenteromicrobium sp.]
MSVLLGIDIGGTAVKIGVVDETGNILLSETRSVSFDGYKTPIMTTVTALAGELLEKSPEKPVGIGVSATGQIDVHTGTVIGVGAHFGNWLGSEVAAILEDAFHLPVTVINDANAAALGEQCYGSARGRDNALVVTIGTGVGGGIIENGRLIQGRRGIGGEIGHYIIDFDGEPCPCGNRGCFERYGSTGALVRRFTGDPALLAELGVPAEVVNGKVIFDHLGQPAVQAAVDRWIDCISFGIVGLVHIFNPEIVLIGGGISREEERFIRPLREKILSRAMQQFAKDLVVEAAALGNNAGLLGACAYFRQIHEIF